MHVAKAVHALQVTILKAAEHFIADTSDSIMSFTGRLASLLLAALLYSTAIVVRHRQARYLMTAVMMSAMLLAAAGFMRPSEELFSDLSDQPESPSNHGGTHSMPGMLPGSFASFHTRARGLASLKLGMVSGTSQAFSGRSSSMGTGREAGTLGGKEKKKSFLGKITKGIKSLAEGLRRRSGPVSHVCMSYQTSAYCVILAVIPLVV